MCRLEYICLENSSYALSNVVLSDELRCHCLSTYDVILSIAIGNHE